MLFDIYMYIRTEKVPENMYTQFRDVIYVVCVYIFGPVYIYMSNGTIQGVSRL